MGYQAKGGQMSNTSITLGKHFEDFANEQVKSGRYGSVSEVIRAGLRILEEHEAKIEALRTALIEGENSGKADYSLKKLSAELDKKNV
jgi:antitoxin ParD1/3/4